MDRDLEDEVLPTLGSEVSAAKEPRFYGDGGGLYLQVSQYGTKSWVFRFKMNGKTRDMGLGSIGNLLP